MKKLIWVLVLMAMAVQVKAEVPKLINYSGKLTDKQGNVLEDKIYDIRFSLCTTQTGETEVWAEEHYNAQGRGVQTYGGGFNVVLGGTTPLPAFEQNYWIEIRINIKGTDETFARQEMLSVPYAMRAECANGIVDNSITSSKIQDESITNLDIGANAVGASEIADGALGENIKIITGAVNNGQVLSPPAGYTKEQCKVFVSLKEWTGGDSTVEDNWTNAIQCFVDGEWRVTCRVHYYYGQTFSAWHDAIANYMIIGIR